MTERERQLVELLMDMVEQHCQVNPGMTGTKMGFLHHSHISTNEEVFGVLEEMGLMRRDGAFFKLSYHRLPEMPSG